MPSLTTTRNRLALSFILNGLFFATLTSRLPAVRDELGLSNGALGLLLLSVSAGSVLALVLSGRVLERFGARATVRGGAALCMVGLVGVAFGAAALGSTPVVAVSLYLYGTGVAGWDVAMNHEGAEVERRLGRTIMPRFHAAWSIGSIVGAGLGVPMVAADVPLPLHQVPVALVLFAVAAWSAGSFLPEEEPERHDEPVVSAWRESRTVLIGVMVLAFAMVEGTAYDWLALALIDGYDVPHWIGTAGFGVFVVSMLVGRLVGPVVLDRVGRPVTLWACTATALVGSLLTVFGGHLPVAVVGIVIWGVGASLGFPVGMSAAADDPRRAAARLSVVSTIGYGAFLVGPPLLGQLGDAVGTLRSLLVVAALMVPAAIAVLAARPAAPGPVRMPPQRLEI